MKFSDALRLNTLETYKSKSLNKTKIRDQYLNMTTSPPDTWIDSRTFAVEKINRENS